MSRFEYQLGSTGLLLALVLTSPPALAQDSTAVTRAQVLLTHALPPMDGGHLALTVVEVRYGPGESSPPHTHACPVVGYVIDGALRTQVRGEPETIYTAGQSFYEAANGAHVVSANASTEQPVRFLAYFTCDHKAPLTTPLPQAAHPEHR